MRSLAMHLGRRQDANPSQPFTEGRTVERASFSDCPKTRLAKNWSKTYGSAHLPPSGMPAGRCGEQNMFSWAANLIFYCTLLLLYGRFKTCCRRAGMHPAAMRFACRAKLPSAETRASRERKASAFLLASHKGGTKKQHTPLVDGLSQVAGALFMTSGLSTSITSRVSKQLWAVSAHLAI